MKEIHIRKDLSAADAVWMKPASRSMANGRIYIELWIKEGKITDYFLAAKITLTGIQISRMIRKKQSEFQTG